MVSRKEEKLIIRSLFGTLLLLLISEKSKESPNKKRSDPSISLRAPFFLLEKRKRLEL